MFLKYRATRVCKKYGMTLDSALVKILNFDRRIGKKSLSYIKTVLCGISEKDAKVLHKYILRTYF